MPAASVMEHCGSSDRDHSGTDLEMESVLDRRYSGIPTHWLGSGYRLCSEIIPLRRAY